MNSLGSALVAVTVALAGSPALAAPTRDDFSAAVREIQRAFVDGPFERLDRLHDELLAQRTDDGTPMVEAFEYAFDSQFEATSLVRLEARLEAWRAASPESRLQPIAEAFMWQQRALKAHGAWCKPLDAEGKPLASKFLARSASALSRADPAASPLWYTVSLRVLGAQGAATDRLERLLDQGRAAHPDYLPMYWARAAFMLPPWASDFRAFDTFARTRPAGGSGGAAASYALLYVTVARQTCGDFLESTLVSWEQMRTGLEALASARDTPWNWNLLGTFACRFRDAETTRAVLDRLGPSARLDIWTSGQSTASCSAMARAKSVIPAPHRVESEPVSIIDRRQGA